MHPLPQTPTVTPAPATCPFCKSAAVVTTSKTVSLATYWRCGGCGQVWNPARLVQTPRWR